MDNYKSKITSSNISISNENDIQIQRELQPQVKQISLDNEFHEGNLDQQKQTPQYNPVLNDQLEVSSSSSAFSKLNLDEEQRVFF